MFKQKQQAEVEVEPQQRKAALDEKIAQIERKENYELFSRNDYEAKLRSTYEWSHLRYFVISVLTLGIGLVLYPFYFSGKKFGAQTMMVYLSVNEQGEVHRSITKDTSPLS